MKSESEPFKREYCESHIVERIEYWVKRLKVTGPKGVRIGIGFTSKRIAPTPKRNHPMCNHDVCSDLATWRMTCEVVQ